MPLYSILMWNVLDLSVFQVYKIVYILLSWGASKLSKCYLKSVTSIQSIVSQRVWMYICIAYQYCIRNTYSRLYLFHVLCWCRMKWRPGEICICYIIPYIFWPLMYILWCIVLGIMIFLVFLLVFVCIDSQSYWGCTNWVNWHRYGFAVIA